jgi:hypothetical protein
MRIDEAESGLLDVTSAQPEVLGKSVEKAIHLWPDIFRDRFEVPTSDTEEREVPINNGVARSITSLWAIWQAQFGGLRGLSHLIRQTGSLSLKSPLALAIWFAGPVLADGPGSRGSDRNISPLIKHMNQVRKHFQ